MAKTQTRTGSNARVTAAQPSVAQRLAASALNGGFRAFSGQSRDFYLLLSVTGVLAAIGIVMVFSASYVDALAANAWAYTDGLHQFIFVIAGSLMLTLFLLWPIAWVQRLVMPIYVGATVVQISVFAIGKEVNGNKNWIALPGGFSLQPSEFLKIALALFLAWWIAKNRDELDDRKMWVQAGIRVGFPIAIVLFQKDLGTSIVIVAMLIGLAVLAGLPRKLLMFVLLAAAVITPLLLRFGSSTRWPRIQAWLFPNLPDPMGYNWQQDHGVWAIAAGRLGGVGLGNSKMKWSWIPEIQNDFIFAVIGEETGMLGCLVIIALFITLVFTMIRIANRATDLFSKLFVQGVAVWIAAQAIINIAVVLDLLPVLGVPLPLISSGGSSMIATLSAIGIVLGVERNNHAGRDVGVAPRGFGRATISTRRR
ncbi:MAG: cell division protein FtsW [Actinomycetales bacterium]|nr:cell division protein FtsW [Actinomycetales bacterium]